MNQRLRRIGAASDSGVAMVAAIAVAIIGLAFSLVVVKQAISITNDAARDRVRTVEVHAAEAALDAAFRQLETLTPCTTEMSVGEGPYAVDVTVGIDYYDDAGLGSGVPLVCNPDGTLSGVPVQAVLTSTALPTNEAPGAVVPERRMEATINLVPLLEPSLGVAIFAGGQMNIANSGSVYPLDPDDTARVWVENSDFNCSNSVVIDADLIVTDGRINISNTCRITGSAWAKTGMSASNNTNPFRVGGDLVVYDGDLSNGGAQKYGGSVSVGGNIWGTLTAAESVCSDNVGSPCPELPLYTKRGLPEVLYDPAEWVGFEARSRAQFAAAVIYGANITKTNDINSITNNPCALTNGIKNPIHLLDPDGVPKKAIYNLLTCAPLSTANQITLVIYEDTAFFVNGFTASNSFTVQSGDGEEHNVWFIVPTGYSGSISLSNTSTIIPPIHVFLFTPNTLNFANQQNMVGQAYSTNVNGSNSLTFLYSGMGIPGVDLSDPTEGSAPAGYSVEIVSKKEIHN